MSFEKPNSACAPAVATAPPATLVIFGAGGDLAQRLLIPALYNLADAGLLPERFRLLGLDHNERSSEAWRTQLGQALHELAQDPAAEFHSDHIAERAWSWLAQRLSYLTADFSDPATYRSLAERLRQIASEIGSGNVLFYLAVAPRFFAPIAEALAKAGLLTESDGQFRRLLVEKPFGQDLASAQALNRCLLALGGERQIFRIDHWLGKETVQNILALRFASPLFEPLWRAPGLSHVEITAAETIGLEGRGAYYDAVGALRDMVPNHLFQLVTLLGMEQPSRFAAEPVRDAKADLLRALRPVEASAAVRGQYAAGLLHGKRVAAYREEPRVAADSRTETYVALRLSIEAERWRGVPFYLRTGKRLPARRTEILLHLKPSAGTLFPQAPASALLLALDPEQGLRIAFAAKRPGMTMDVHSVAAAFRYDDFFAAHAQVGYEPLLYHALCGDQLLFQRADFTEAAWAAVQPLIEAWSRGGAPEPYAAGSEGPAGAASLIARDGFRWRSLEG